MNFIVVIPARYESTRFPGKPLADIAGKPMVVRVAERAVKSGARDVLVATDHPAIAQTVRACGYAAVMTRRAHASGTDRIAEVARRLQLPARRIVVNVQGDEPLIPPALIRAVASKLAQARGAHIATACTPIREERELLDPNVVKVVLDDAGHALYFSRAPIPHARDAGTPLAAGVPAYRHLGIYAYRAGFLQRFAKLRPAALERAEALEQLRALARGFRIVVAITRASPHPGVDTPADLERVRRHFDDQA